MNKKTAKLFKMEDQQKLTDTSDEHLVDVSPSQEKAKPLVNWQPIAGGFVKALRSHRGSQWLTAVLTIQLLLAGSLYWNSRLDGEFLTPTAQLLDLDVEQIDRLVMRDLDNEVILNRQQNIWHLDNKLNSPADQDKISALLSTLNTLKPGLAVASSESSRAQLDVADDDFQRRILIQSGDNTVADIFLGSSPGFRKSHVRLAEQNDIFAATINSFDVPVDQDDWLDKTLLAFNDVEGIKTDTIALERQEQGWKIAKPLNQADSHEVDSAGMDELLSTLQNLRVTGISVNEPELNAATMSAPSSGVDEPVAEPSEILTENTDASELEPQWQLSQLTVIDSGQLIKLTLAKRDNKLVVQRDDIDGYYTASVSTFDDLAIHELERLIVEKPEGGTETVDEAIDSESQDSSGGTDTNVN